MVESQTTFTGPEAAPAGDAAPAGARLGVRPGWLVRTARFASRLAPGSPGPTHLAFGTFCHTAAALRDSGLRAWSGPLDWIFSTPGLATACLRDGFSSLIDPRELRSVPPGDLTHGAKRQCRHLRYEDRFGLPTLFNHHDPAASASDRARIGRAVGRMERSLRGGRNVLWMMSEVDWPDAEVAMLHGELRARSIGNELVVLRITAGRERGWTARVAAPGLVVAEVRTRSRSTGVRFADPLDDAHLASVLLDPSWAGPRASNGHNPGS